MAAVSVGALALPPGVASAASSSTPKVAVVIMENHEYGDIIGNPSAPYINQLAQTTGLATQSYAWSHPSLPNYLELVAGQHTGITTDCTTCVAQGTNLADQLGAKGISWGAYMESLPSVGYTGDGPYPYAKRHDPFVYFPQTDKSHVVPYGQLGSDLATHRGPSFIWVSPNVLDDMHDGTVAQGDTWLSQNLPPLINGGYTVILTWDEGTTSAGFNGAAGGHVPTIVVNGHNGQQTAEVNHAGVLRTIEDLYGLPYLGDAADAANGNLHQLTGGNAGATPNAGLVAMPNKASVVAPPNKASVVAPNKGPVATPNKVSVVAPTNKASVVTPNKGPVTTPNKASVLTPNKGPVATPNKASVVTPNKGSTSAAPAFAAPTQSFTCAGTAAKPGMIPAGTYRSLTMPPATVCLMGGSGAVDVLSPVSLGTGSGLVLAGGSFTVGGSLMVGPRAAFAALSNSTPVDIRGPVLVQNDGAFALGTETPNGPRFASIRGPVTGVNVSTVQIHNTSVFGPVTLVGGGTDNALVDALAAQAGAAGPRQL